MQAFVDKNGIYHATTPMGRVVSKDAFKLVARKKDGLPVLIKTGDHAGEQSYEQVVGLAIRKDNPEWPEFFAGLKAYAESVCEGLTANPKFAWKGKDGDTGLSIGDPNGYVDPEKRINDNHKGCWVIWFSAYHGSLAPCFVNDASLQSYTTVEQAGIEPKPGDYARVLFSGKSNGNKQYGERVPGVLIGPDKILIVEIGSAISFEGEDSIAAGDAFGGFNDPAMNTAPGMESAVQQPVQPPVQQPVQPPVVQADKTQFMTGQAAPPATPAPPAEDVPLYQFGAKGVALGHLTADGLVEAYKKGGWTVKQIQAAEFIQ